MDGTLMLQAEQLMCGPLSKLWDICLGCASSCPWTHLCCIEGALPIELIFGIVGIFVGGIVCPCLWLTYPCCFWPIYMLTCCIPIPFCCPCSIVWIPISWVIDMAGYYIGTIPTTICCLACISPYHCLGCCPGMTYECIGPFLGKFEVCLWPYITRFTSCLNRFTCPCL